MKKGQAAIEFLTTYSWAIMAVLLSIGVLSYFDLLSIDRYVSESCDTGSQIICRESILQGEELTLHLVNTYPVDIEISRITYSYEGQDFPEPIGETINRGQNRTIPATLGGANFNPGSKERIELLIEFSRDVTGARTYNATGTTVVTAR